MATEAPESGTGISALPRTPALPTGTTVLPTAQPVGAKPWNVEWDILMWSLFGYPPEADVIPNHEITPDSWVLGSETTGNNSFFDTQWVDCLYPYSGVYQETTRGIFYALIPLSLLLRKIDWLANVVVGLVMTYSSTAAVHALALAIVRKRMAPHIIFENNWEMVKVEGDLRTSTSYSSSDPALWLPVVPMALDFDTDPILAIVGTAFLALIPMQIWSKTLKVSSRRPLVILWGLLLFTGSLAAIVSKTYQNRWDFAQLRFCPTGRNDTLPIVNNGPNPYVEPWTIGDRYRWNRAIQDHFVFENSTTAYPTACIYPCFGSKWPLRNYENIYVRHTHFNDGGFYVTPSLRALLSAYILIISCGLADVTLVTIVSVPFFREWRDIRLKSELRKIKKVRNTEVPSIRKYVRLLFALWVLLVTLYSFFFSIPIILFFVGYWEWVMWGAPTSEGFQNIGQWGSIVNLGLLLGAALISFVLSWWKKKKRNEIEEGMLKRLLRQAGLFT